MSTYTIAEFDEAKTALTSTLHKYVKIDEGKKRGKSQQILLDRRIKALRIALGSVIKAIVDTDDED